MNISIHLNKAHFLAQKFPFTFIWKASFFLEWHKGIYRAIRISIAHLNADEGYLKYLNHLNLIHNIYIWHFSFAPDKVCGGLFQIFFFFRQLLSIFWAYLFFGWEFAPAYGRLRFIQLAFNSFCLTFNLLACFVFSLVCARILWKYGNKCG